MAVPVPLRGDFDAAQLRGLARKSKDGPQARRLLALASIYDGTTRSEAAKIGGVGVQIVRDWVLRFNAHGADGLLDRKAPGRALQTQQCPARDNRPDDRKRPDPGDPRRGALAVDRSGAMELRGVPHHHCQADAEPGTSRHRLSQALGAPTPSCSGRGRDRRF